MSVDERMASLGFSWSDCSTVCVLHISHLLWRYEVSLKGKGNLPIRVALPLLACTSHSSVRRPLFIKEVPDDDENDEKFGTRLCHSNDETW